MTHALLQIFVFRDSEYVGSEVFVESEVVIGRGDDAQLRLDESGIAAHHALLKHEEGQVSLLDLGSGNTFINGQPIEHTEVTPRDEIRIGSHTLKFKFVTPKGKRSSVSAASHPTRRVPPPPPPPRGASLLAKDLAPDPSAGSSGNVSASIDLLIQKELSRDLSRRRPKDDTGFDSESRTHFDSGNIVALPASTSPRSNGQQEPAFDSVDQAFESTFTPAAGLPTLASPDYETVEEPSTRLLKRAPVNGAPTPKRTPTKGPGAQAPVPHYELEPTAVEVEDHAEEIDPEEIEADLRPGFSLRETLKKPDPKPPKGARTPTPALEIVHFSADEVRALTLLRTGERFTVKGQKGGNDPFKAFRLARVNKSGEAIVEFPKSATGKISDGSEKVKLDALKTSAYAVSKKGTLYRTQLKKGKTATICLGQSEYRLRFVHPPALATDNFQFRIDRLVAKAIGFAVVLHLVVGAMVGLASAGVTYSERPTEQWSEPEPNDLRDVEIPEPEPEPEPEPVAEPEPEPEPEAPPPKRRKQKTKPKRVAKKAPRGVSRKNVKARGVLGAIGGKLNLKAPGRSSIVARVSNIDAVKAPGGSNYRIGAPIGKTPSSKISLGGGGGGKMLTRGAAKLLRRGGGMRIGKPGGARVRGKVTRASARRLKAKGSISREEVARVINKHLKEVQYCYEKTLLRDPGLAGKLVLEWHISTSGRVGRVRQKLSTIRNPGVAKCIISSLKRWTFPKPRGGVVVVSYPFIFSSTGF